MDALTFIKNVSLEESKNRKVRLLPKKILVVEDDTSMTVLLGKAILDIFSDAEIQWAASLEQAVTQLIQNTDIGEKVPYDLIIADIFLEGNGTGLDLWKVLGGTYPNIPFLMISSLSQDQVVAAVPEERRKSLVYLQKPFLFAQCKQSIKNILPE
ncbi:MAG: response regulator [Bdellovibrionaceae bacterium]|nr:response regulator [Pseudobdellovibrionaceae bacterium]